MIDNDMTNILRNFAGAGTGEITDAKTGEAKVNTATQDKNAMKSLLEGLDSAQKSVNQMPATHTMAKNTDTAHPAEKFLVGGEFDEETELDESGADAYQKTYADEYEMGVPPSQNSREKVAHQIKPGVQVHVGHHVSGGSGVEGKVTKVEDGFVFIKNAEGKTYKGQLKNTTVNEAQEDTYEDTIAKRNTDSNVHDKQSFKDVFRSMDETEDDMTTRFKKELHDEKTSKALTKGDNGKYDLAEEDSGWGDELIEDLKLLVQDASQYDGIIDTQSVLELIQQYEAPLAEDNIISSSHNAPIDQHVEALGAALYDEAVELAREVYNDEGPGQSNARNEEEYVKHLVTQFLDKEYLRAIMGNIIEAYNNEAKGSR